jgi:hypothetical protein
MLADLQNWIQQNPHRGTSVPPIEIQIESDTGGEKKEAISGPGGLVATPIEPPGPVALSLWYTDPLYRAGTYTLRKQILREELMKLGVKIEETCKGRRWNRVKILEQLAAQQTSAVSPQQDTRELDDALCEVLGVQKLIIDDANKKILQFPEDFRRWTNELPVWTCGLGSRCVYHLPGEKSLSEGLGAWISEREAEGWKVRWPVADGKLDELKKKATDLSISFSFQQKPLKDDYALAVGRAEAIRRLTDEFSIGATP